eukprot:777505-Pleurochrysis_carterae.AAC.1
MTSAARERSQPRIALQQTFRIAHHFRRDDDDCGFAKAAVITAITVTTLRPMAISAQAVIRVAVVFKSGNVDREACASLEEGHCTSFRP